MHVFFPSFPSSFICLVMHFFLTVLLHIFMSSCFPSSFAPSFIRPLFSFVLLSLFHSFLLFLYPFFFHSFIPSLHTLELEDFLLFLLLSFLLSFLSPHFICIQSIICSSIHQSNY